VFLAESILHPSKSIRKGFELMTVITDEGRAITGFKVEENDDVLVLRDPAGGKKSTVDQDAIDEISPSEISAMPAGLANQLAGRQQFMDLLRFVIDINGRGSMRLEQLKAAIAK